MAQVELMRSSDLERDQLATRDAAMRKPRYPSLYQINTRVWLTERSRALGRPATLDDVPDAELDRAAEMGFDWVWLLSVWRTGPAGQRVSRANREWRREFEETLPDLREEDIAGSGFAITGSQHGDETEAREKSIRVEVTRRYPREGACLRAGALLGKRAGV